MSEFIYVLENVSMPGLVKIGRTERSVSERVNELSSHTGVPTGFAVVKEYAVKDSAAAEKTIHARLSDYRVADNREFFKIEAEDVMDIIESILDTVKPETRRDFEREDELIAEAIPIVLERGMARPRMLEEKLGISYEEALFVIQALQGRGFINKQNETSGYPRPSITVAATPIIGNYQLPSMDFLQLPDMTLKPTESKEELLANARLMQLTLAQFDIPVELGDITKGPTITRYEFHVFPGVQLEEISALSNNLAAVLNTDGINIFAPIPSKSTVVVDVPNLVKAKVIMRDLFESDEWRNTKARIPIALGKDSYGYPIIADLAEMPHLLIAGSTGSGKSVCVNAIIASLLYRFTPDQLRFVMIDPNVVELQQYNVLPHLVVPVVRDPKKAILALRWVVNEMEKRFQIFIRVGARNIATFNARPNNNAASSHEDNLVIPEKLSYLVVIIESLEDLMQAAKADLETALKHLTQNARATGIHLVLTAANRNTIPEGIRAEIAARIALRCASRIESRSIIGEAGAEKLSGKGDMLYLSPDSGKLIRLQGALVTDQEIQSVVDFIAKQAKPSYELAIHQHCSTPSYGAGGGVDEDEETIQKCIEVIRSERKVSVSLLQRQLCLSYESAARIMDELENRGIVGPSKGAEPRDIMIDLDTAEQQSPDIQAHLIVCLCEHCSGKIEFDANELGDRQSVSVPCPHCGVDTTLSLASQ